MVLRLLKKEMFPTNDSMTKLILLITYIWWSQMSVKTLYMMKLSHVFASALLVCRDVLIQKQVYPQ